MLNVRTLIPGNLLLLNKKHEFYNDGMPSEKERFFTPWIGIEKKYKILNLHNKGKYCIIKQGEPILFLDFLYRIITKDSFDHKSHLHKVKTLQIGILALYQKNNIFISLNSIRYDVYNELPNDIRENFYTTYLFKIID